MARKPFKGSVAKNVLEWGTGGINIDECRIGSEEREGRFPANFIHDGIEEDWARYFYCPKASKKDRNEGCDELEEKGYSINQAHNSKTLEERYALTSKNNHPTVKPTDLMAYLVRLVTPKGGTVLDPFMGSGSTGKASVREGMDFIGIEREDEYMEIAKTRIQHEEGKHKYRTFFDI
jgi:DNA modification methylase